MLDELVKDGRGIEGAAAADVVLAARVSLHVGECVVGEQFGDAVVGTDVDEFALQVVPEVEAGGGAFDLTVCRPVQPVESRRPRNVGQVRAEDADGCGRAARPGRRERHEQRGAAEARTAAVVGVPGHVADHVEARHPLPPGSSARSR
ncbi:hypothetical protein [Streptomyces tubercidicus]